MITYASRYFDESEEKNILEAIKDNHLTHGRFCNKFEKELAANQCVDHTLMVNSGSSAMLLSFMALTQPELKERQIKRNDEIITTACCFPTTLAPIVQYGAIPVFIDVTIPEYNIDVSQLEKALSSKTKAVVLAHTMGMPFNLSEVETFCVDNGLWLISDCSDALGALWNGLPVGNYGDVSTFSFYPAHHITTGEGGAVCTNNSQLAGIMGSLRDWGRECICTSGHDNICGKRLNGEYDHKYVYSHFGYNLKATEFQGALGVAQINKLEEIKRKRLINWSYFDQFLCNKYFYKPKYLDDGSPSPFGYVITLKQGRNIEMQKYMEGKGIQTRPLFAGNILRHPCMKDIEYKQVGSLLNTDIIYRNTLWWGIHPKLSIKDIEYIINTIKDYFR